MAAGEIKFGARVYFFTNDVILVLQTKSLGGDRHVLDLCGNAPKQEYVNPGPNQAQHLLDVMRRAKLGELPPKQKGGNSPPQRKAG